MTTPAARPSNHEPSLSIGKFSVTPAHKRQCPLAKALALMTAISRFLQYPLSRQTIFARFSMLYTLLK